MGGHRHPHLVGDVVLRQRRVDPHEALRRGVGTGRVAALHLAEELLGLRLEPVGHPGAGQPLGGQRQRQVEPEGDVGLAHRAAAAVLHPALQRRQHLQVEPAAGALVGEGGVGETVAQHHLAAGQGRFDHLLQMVAPGGEDQQRLGQRVHRVLQHQGAEFFGQRRAARLPGDGDRPALRAERVGDAVDMRALARTVDALERNEDAVRHRKGYFLRWYWSTARLCSSSDGLKWLVPSPRETKYSACVASGCTAASSAARPGMAMGVGGRPVRV